MARPRPASDPAPSATESNSCAASPISWWPLALHSRQNSARQEVAVKDLGDLVGRLAGPGNELGLEDLFPAPLHHGAQAHQGACLANLARQTRRHRQGEGLLAHGTGLVEIAAVQVQKPPGERWRGCGRSG